MLPEQEAHPVYDAGDADVWQATEARVDDRAVGGGNDILENMNDADETEVLHKRQMVAAAD